LGRQMYFVFYYIILSYDIESFFAVVVVLVRDGYFCHSFNANNVLYVPI